MSYKIQRNSSFGSQCITDLRSQSLLNNSSFWLGIKTPPNKCIIKLPKKLYRPYTDCFTKQIHIVPTTYWPYANHQLPDWFTDHTLTTYCTNSVANCFADHILNHILTTYWPCYQLLYWPHTDHVTNCFTDHILTTYRPCYQLLYWPHTIRTYWPCYCTNCFTNYILAKYWPLCWAPTNHLLSTSPLTTDHGPPSTNHRPLTTCQIDLLTMFSDQLHTSTTVSGATCLLLWVENKFWFWMRAHNITVQMSISY